MSTTEYLYCIIPTPIDAPAPLGIDDHPIRLIPFGPLFAVIGTLDSSIYQPQHLEHHLADLRWLEPRAIAHDRVVTWFSDHIATLPVPMWTLFSDTTHLVNALTPQTPHLHVQLTKVHGAHEYTVRLFANTTELTAHLTTLSPTIAELEHAATTATPGQAYLLQRKLTDARKHESRAVIAHIADTVYTSLSTHAIESTRDPLPQSNKDQYAALNASFLVATPAYDTFRQALTTLVDSYQPTGFHFDFTGPWPAYHFVRLT